MTLPKRSRREQLTVELHGKHVVLMPLRPEDVAEIARVPDDPAYTLLLRRFTGTDRAARWWVRNALAGMRSGREMCWLIRRTDTAELLGSTRLLNVDLSNGRVEIGATWLVASARGGPANAESKLMLLHFAFDQLAVRRVHIQADVRNERSRAAIERLGATFEGILRQHIVLADGTSRDTAVYSITWNEWPACREIIRQRVAERAWPALVPSTVYRSGPDPGLDAIPVSA